MSDELELELDIEELKNEAASLGVKHNASIGSAKLKEKIDAHYKSLEKSGPALDKLIEKVEEEENKKPTATASKKLDPKVVKRKAREAAAKKTRIIVIVDNDQRQNNQTT